MALLFGILFRNPDTGTCAQLGLETGSNNLYVRSMEKTGGWSDWERIGGGGGGSSSTTPVTPASPTTTANAALRLVAPLKLTLKGDASGSVSFDGSEGVVKLQVSVAKVAGSDAVTEARAEEIARKVAAQLVEEHRRAYDHYTTNSGN